MLASLLDCDLLDAIEVAHDIVPLRIHVGSRQPLIELLAQEQGEERTKQMAGNGGVGLVIDRPRLQNRFRGFEDRLHSPQLTIREGDRERGQLAVGTQHVQPVEPGVLGYPVRIDFKTALARRG